MYNFKIITVGKIKEKWLDSGIKDYEKRLSNIASFQWLLTKNDLALSKLCEKEKHFICLDIAGLRLSSEKFSSTLLKTLENQGASLSIVIGGPEGLSPVIKSKAASSISLSDLTFTHQLVRLILLEQIYRAFEIDKGSPYHK